VHRIAETRREDLLLSAQPVTGLPDDCEMANSKLESYIWATTPLIGPAQAHVEEALQLIMAGTPKGADAQTLVVLALRRYLRMGGERVNVQWAWTPEEALQHARSPELALLHSEAAKMQANFAKNNPGYMLTISPLRNLERQVYLWDTNMTLRATASRVSAAAIRELGKEMYPDPAGRQAAVQFAAFLRRTEVNPEPSSAAPGTSDHGQAHAVDFVVIQNGVAIATTKTETIASIWKARGWENKLIQAAEGTQLLGPLKVPYEPWHWRIGR
jgi:hypothetical protein